MKFIKKSWIPSINHLGWLILASLLFLGAYRAQYFPDFICKGPYVDARAYTSINAAIANAETLNKTVRISSNMSLTAALTVPSTRHLEFLEGGKITCGDHNLTINGPMSGPISQRFDDSGAGSVSFGLGYIEKWHPEWWGSTGDAIQNAFDSAPDGATIKFLTKVYTVSSPPLTLDDQKGLKFEGAGKTESQAGTIITTTSASNLLEIGETTVCHDLTFRDMNFWQAGTGKILLMSTANNSLMGFENVDFRRTNTGAGNTVDITNLVQGDFLNCTFRNLAQSTTSVALKLTSCSTISLRGRKTRIEADASDNYVIGIHANAGHLTLSEVIFENLYWGLCLTDIDSVLLLGCYFEDMGNLDIRFEGVTNDYFTMIGCLADGSWDMSGTTPNNYINLNNNPTTNQYIYSEGNIAFRLGDAAGAKSFAIQDSGGVSVVYIDSNGQLVTGHIIPLADDTSYLGQVSGAFKAYKALVLHDTTDGKHYKFESINGVLTATALD